MPADGMARLPADAVAPALGEKPPLLVEPADPDRTVARLRDALAGAGRFFDRGAPVRKAEAGAATALF